MSEQDRKRMRTLIRERRGGDRWLGATQMNELCDLMEAEIKRLELENRKLKREGE